MIIALVKTGDRQFPGEFSSDSPWKLLFLGLALMNGMALLFIPLGIYGSVSLTAAVLLSLFLPLLFLVIRLSGRFGNLLYIALFLSLLSAGVSSLYISHSVGLFLGVPPGNNADLAEKSEFENDRVLVFRGIRILTESVFSRSAVIREKTEPKRSKPIYFHVAPLVSSAWKEGDPIRVWVACERMEFPTCSWGKSVFFWGENLESHSLYPFYKQAVQDAAKLYRLPISEKVTIFRPIQDAEKRLLRGGMFGVSGLFFLNYSWFVCIFLAKFFGKGK
ncbi:hypothetical protein EHQ12_03790 [Leptospira gomenensis]|uniref:DUF4131 domain-containing protein n=1 Tax=Leptospira gomenensis TaxID=2484974 RepID=A0A5F1YTZ7_9LEPT|nr:hypothetical protein [Leptospira gomenensis]TGK31705.1 hypothetical protein EHQ17_13045 [Leptospira gomenensis]TGK41666.1 hypothetical protein EHQ07_16425 [Leptospira gomenensis]TGK43380.1 hypothetical protein EHQ12_03790 [Leptospira gomenensis]TGK61374.1 hypothetical protein EHQ13_08440 [Leptospira gomenensis]